MPKLVSRRWEDSPDSGLPRRDRVNCSFDAYVPDHLADRRLVLDGRVAADVADAEAALRRFDADALSLADTEALARLLLRAESVASSRIEGLEVGGRRLLRAEAASALGEEHPDVTAAEVLGNVAAMSWSIAQVEPGGTITLEQLLESHRRLLSGTRLEALGGQLREGQNWIGGSSFNPCSAEFVPPPEWELADLLDDLLRFCNEDDLPAVVQAALAHSQFETIHPFVDGNGRIGRILIQLVFRRRGLSTRTVPPTSLVLATWSQSYVEGLSGTRTLGTVDSPEATEGVNRWVELFAAACCRAIEDAEAFEARIASLMEGWRLRLASVRRGSSVDLLVEALPGAPVITVKGAAELIGRSQQAAGLAVDRLVDAGVLVQAKAGRRNRVFEAPEVIAAFTDLERQLASPGGGTASSPPSRSVPRRR